MLAKTLKRIGDVWAAGGKQLTGYRPAFERLEDRLAPAVTPLQVGPTGRYLVDGGGTPVLLQGDAAWGLVASTTPAGADLYLTDRASKGFNAVMVMLLSKFTDNVPANAAGAYPFYNPQTGQTRAFIDPPNEAYFAYADQVISLAEQKGIYVLLAPAYLGYQGGSEGFYQEVVAAGPAAMRQWGQYVGNRYKDFDNIIWVQSGDFSPPAAGRELVNQVALGIRDFDTVHLHTAHSGRGVSAEDTFGSYPWLTLNSTYTADLTYPLSLLDYNRTPATPSFLIEDYYENEHGLNQQQYRAEKYWSVLSGSTGVQMGNRPMWAFDWHGSWQGVPMGNWQPHLNSQLANDMMRLGDLFTARAWYNLVPDQNHTVVTAGYGTFGSGDYVTAARSGDGTLVMAYTPSARTLTVNMAQLSGPVTARWFDPTTGNFSAIAGSPFANSGSRTFSTPGNNSTGFSDWVLVLEASSTPNTPPTVATPAAASPATVSATTTNLSVLGADNGGEANLTYTWTVTVAPPGATPSFSANGSNAAKYSTVTFNRAGSYSFQATIRDGGGLTATSSVNVLVNPTLTSIVVTPFTAALTAGATQAFTAQARDQFSQALSAQPAIAWSIDSGGIGSINGSGLYTAPAAGSGTATVRAASGSVSGTAGVTVAPADPFNARINFTTATGEAVAGYLADTGAAFGNRGNGLSYGWNLDSTLLARDRDLASPGELYDSLNHLQKPENPNASWEIAVPNGSYTVRLAAGDPGFFDSIYRINAESVLAINGTPTSSQRWFENTVMVVVSDGRLTLSNAAGAANNKINFVEITGSGTPANQPPTVATAAAASPSPVTGSTTNLSVLGADDGGEANLTYTWAATSVPSGALPSFSANGSNAAKNSTVTFNRPGSYTFQVTIRDAAGLTAASSVNVTVNPTLTVISVSPSIASVASGGTQQFTASASDQFGQAMNPAITWSLAGGIGTINASGLYTAPASTGSATVRASSGAVSGTANVTVTASAPFSARINFTNTGGEAVAGYLADTGLAYGDRGNGLAYGWNVDSTAQARDRDLGNSPGELYDSFNHMQKPENPNGYWEIAVPNGTYTVRLAAGDPGYLDSLYRINVEGVLAINGTPTSGQQWFENTITVTVTDGRLTISNAAGAVNNKINFIEITAVAP